MKYSALIFFNFLILFPVLFISGCKDRFYDMEDFQSVKKIDAHVHINTTNDALIEQARNDNFQLLSLNVDTGRMPINEQQQITVDLKNRFPAILSFTTALTMEGWDDPENWQKRTLDYLDKSFSNGALGVKVWKNIGMEFKDKNGEFIMIDDPRFDPVFDYLVQQGKPLFGHIGEPKNCWLPLEQMTVHNDREYFKNNPRYHMHLHPEFPSYEEIIEARNNMLDKHPDLIFFGAHLGSMEWSIDMMVDHLNRYPNMVLGMAHRVPHLQYLAQQDREKLRDFFIEYQDRLLYSTDLQHYEESDPEEIRDLARDTWREDWEFFVTDNTLSVWQVEGSFQGLKLPKEVIDKIFRENARKLLPGIVY